MKRVAFKQGALTGLCGPYGVANALFLLNPGRLSVAEASEAVDRIEASVRRAVPAARMMYLEPDIFRTTVPRTEGDPAHLAGSAATDASPEQS